MSSFRLFMISCAFALIASGGLSFYFWTQWQRAQQEHSSFTSNVKNQEGQLAELEVQLAKAEKEAHFYRGSEKYVLFKEDGLEMRTVTLYRDPGDASLYIDVSQMPPPPTGRQYNLWVREGRKWVKFGEIDVSDAKSEPLKKIGELLQPGRFLISIDNPGSAIPLELYMEEKR